MTRSKHDDASSLGARPHFVRGGKGPGTEAAGQSKPSMHLWAFLSLRHPQHLKGGFGVGNMAGL